jgi:hypothetical protein
MKIGTRIWFADSLFANRPRVEKETRRLAEDALERYAFDADAKILPESLDISDEPAYDTETGELVPGMTMRTFTCETKPIGID